MKKTAAVTTTLLGASFMLTGCQQTPEHIDIALIDNGQTGLDQFSNYEILNHGENSTSDHGTMMLSSILGVNSDSPLDPEAVTIHSYDIGDAPSPTDIAKAIEAAVADNAKVINISLGVRRPNAEIEQALQSAKNAGSFVVASTGNVRTLAPDYPARYEAALSVAAVERNGECWTGNPCDKADLTEAGVNIPVSKSNGKVVEESGSSIAAAETTRKIAKGILSGRIKDASKFEPSQLNG